MIKVIHLLNHLEKIDRDLDEIGEMKNKLQLDRTYTSRVQESLASETQRLGELQSTISKLTIKEPPEYLALDLETFIAGNNQIRIKPTQPTIQDHQPQRKPAHAEIKLPSKPIADKKTIKASPSSADKKPIAKKTSSAKEAPFRWKFVQK